MSRNNKKADSGFGWVNWFSLEVRGKLVNCNLPLKMRNMSCQVDLEQKTDFPIGRNHQKDFFTQVLLGQTFSFVSREHFKIEACPVADANPPRWQFKLINYSCNGLFLNRHQFIFNYGDEAYLEDGDVISLKARVGAEDGREDTEIPCAVCFLKKLKCCQRCQFCYEFLSVRCFIVT